MRTFTINLGTTAVNIWTILTGIATFAGASVQGSRTLEKKMRPTVKELVITADDANTGNIFIGGNSGVASTDYGVKLLPGAEHFDRQDTPCIPLTQWLVSDAASQKVRIKIIWG